MIKKLISKMEVKIIYQMTIYYGATVNGQAIYTMKNEKFLDSITELLEEICEYSIDI